MLLNLVAFEDDKKNVSSMARNVQLPSVSRKPTKSPANMVHKLATVRLKMVCKKMYGYVIHCGGSEWGK